MPKLDKAGLPLLLSNYYMMIKHLETLIEERGYKFAGPQVEVEEARHCVIFSCIRLRDGARVKLRVLNLAFPLPRHLCNFQHEYKIVEELRETEGVVKIYDRFSVGSVEALVLEDFGGEGLDKWLQREGPFVERLPQFIALAIDITKTLSQIHAHNIVHQDIQVGTYTC